MLEDNTIKSAKPLNVGSVPVLDELRLWRKRLLDVACQKKDVRATLQRLAVLKASRTVLNTSEIRATIAGLMRRFGDAADVVSAGTQLTARRNEIA